MTPEQWEYHRRIRPYWLALVIMAALQGMVAGVIIGNLWPLR